jgi:hypothetical protein
MIDPTRISMERVPLGIKECCKYNDSSGSMPEESLNDGIRYV